MQIVITMYKQFLSAQRPFSRPIHVTAKHRNFINEFMCEGHVRLEMHSRNGSFTLTDGRVFSYKWL